MNYMNQKLEKGNLFIETKEGNIIEFNDKVNIDIKCKTVKKDNNVSLKINNFNKEISFDIESEYINNDLLKRQFDRFILEKRWNIARYLLNSEVCVSYNNMNK